MTDRKVVDFAVTCKDGQYVILQMYEGGGWDAFCVEGEDPLNAAKTMLLMKIQHGLLQESEIPS